MERNNFKFKILQWWKLRKKYKIGKTKNIVIDLKPYFVGSNRIPNFPHSSDGFCFTLGNLKNYERHCQTLDR